MKEERELALKAAVFCRNTLGMSVVAFEEAIDLGDIVPVKYMDALVALRDRGELEHLIRWVWYPIRK